MGDPVLLFFAAFVLVGLKGYQTKVVAASQTKMAFFVSMMIATGQYVMVVSVIEYPFVDFILSFGLGGSCGICVSIILHDRLTARANARVNPDA